MTHHAGLHGLPRSDQARLLRFYVLSIGLITKKVLRRHRKATKQNSSLGAEISFIRHSTFLKKQLSSPYNMAAKPSLRGCGQHVMESLKGDLIRFLGSHHSTELEWQVVLITRVNSAKRYKKCIINYAK